MRAEDIAAFVLTKLSESKALPGAPTRATESDPSFQAPRLSAPDRKQMTVDLANQQNVFGDAALDASAPSPELREALARLRPSTATKALYGGGGALGGAALMGGLGALLARVKVGKNAPLLRPVAAGAGSGALSGALAGLYAAQRRRIRDAVNEVYGE
jgi:hypothetical protein